MKLKSGKKLLGALLLASLVGFASLPAVSAEDAAPADGNGTAVETREPSYPAVNGHYKNEAFGMEFDLPAAYTEDAGNKPYMYQAHLTDYNMGLMVLMQGRKAGISDSRLKEEVKQVEEIPDQMAKGSKDVKIMDKKMVKAGGYDTLQFAVRGEHDGKPFISVNDFILTNSATYMMSFTMKDTDYKNNQNEIDEILKSVRFFTVWRTEPVRTTKYAYDLPVDVKVGASGGINPDHILLGTNGRLLTGVMVVKSSKRSALSFWPESLSGLTEQQKKGVLDGLKGYLSLDPAMKEAKHLTMDFVQMKAGDAVRVDYDIDDDHTSAWYFAKDKNSICFDYTYGKEDADYAAGIVEKSTASITL